jgi:hypothetical protein
MSITETQVQEIMDSLWLYHFFNDYTDIIDRSKLYSILKRAGVTGKLDGVVTWLITHDFIKESYTDFNQLSLHTGEIFFASISNLKEEPNLAKRALKKIILFLEKRKARSSKVRELLKRYRWEYSIIHPINLSDLEDLQKYPVPTPDWPEGTCKYGFCYRNARTITLDFPENLYVEGYFIDWDGFCQHAWNKIREFYYDVTAEEFFECEDRGALPLVCEQKACLWFVVVEITKTDLEELWDLTSEHTVFPFARGVLEWYYEYHVKKHLF